MCGFDLFFTVAQPPPSRSITTGLRRVYGAKPYPDSNQPPHSTLWRGMWSLGRRTGGSDDPEWQRCVKADAVRKQAT